MPIVSVSLSLVLGLLAALGALPPLDVPSPLVLVEGAIARRKDALQRKRSREDDEMWAAKMDRLAAEEEAAERARIDPFYASKNVRLPEEIFQRILELAFDSPPSTPASPRLPLVGSTSFLVVCRGFSQISLPLLYSSIYISKASDWNLFFNAKRGLLNDSAEGRARRRWVKEISVLDCLLPPRMVETGRRGSWGEKLGGKKKVVEVQPLQISSEGFGNVDHFCVVESPTPFAAPSYVVTRSPKLDASSLDPADPRSQHHHLLLQLIQAADPSTLTIPYTSLFDLHLPEQGTPSPNRATGTPLAISILFPPPNPLDDVIRIKYQTACFQTNLPRFIFGLYESLEWTEMNFVGFPAACQKALSGMRKKYPRGVWADGAEIDWTYYNGRRERPSKAMKISIDLRL